LDYSISCFVSIDDYFFHYRAIVEIIGIDRATTAVEYRKLPTLSPESLAAPSLESDLEKSESHESEPEALVEKLPFLVAI
jgi:hypothetical protein